MGLCISMERDLPETVKLILSDGNLREFSWSVRSSYVLGKDEDTSFICDSDTMEIDRVVKSIGGDKELRLGQIYFVLPNSMLNQPLKAKEMAKLAIKASNALEKVNRGKRGRRGEIVPMTFSLEEEIEEKKIVGRKRSGKGRNFKSDLTVIAE